MNRRDFFKRLLAVTAVLPLARRLPPQPSSDSWPELNFIDLPPHTGNITALVPHRDYLLAFTERAIYRIDAVGNEWRFDGRRFRSRFMDYQTTRVTPLNYL